MPDKKAVNIEDLFLNKIKSLYDIETQLVKAIPKMVKNSSNADLKKALEDHFKQTQGHVKRLEQIFSQSRIKPSKLKVEGIRGIIKDAEWVIKNTKNKQARDAGIISAAEYVEHYEMAGYETAHQWAKQMLMQETTEILGQTLEEEKAAAKSLMDIAKHSVNKEVASVNIE